MNTLLIYGSPRRGGVTEQMVDQLLDGIEHTRVNAYDAAAKPCLDCRGCYVDGRCVMRDLDAFYAALEQAECVVIATPVYHLSFPAPLKALLDRTQPYLATRFIRGIKPPIATPKRVILLSHADKDEHGGEMLVKQLAPALTVLNAKLVAQVHCTASADALPDDVAAQMDALRETMLNNG